MAKPRRPKIEDVSATHKKCVFADDEFINLSNDIVGLLGVNKNNSIDRIRLGGELHYFVGDGAEKIVSKTQSEQIKYLAKEFAIGVSDVMDFMNASHKDELYEFSKPRVEVKYWPPDGITIKVPPDATKQDIINQLDKVKSLQQLFYKSKATKHKPPHDYQLIYAVFRARAKKLGFKQIFKQYQDGTLALYNGSATQHTSSDSLESYYRKYQPKANT